MLPPKDARGQPGYDDRFNNPRYVEAKELHNDEKIIGTWYTYDNDQRFTNFVSHMETFLDPDAPRKIGLRYKVLSSLGPNNNDAVGIRIYYVAIKTK
jgi:hypothetical protein